jgi:curved DNA-binding protein
MKSTLWHPEGHFTTLALLKTANANHYATLGLDRRCTAAQIREAYRLLARRHHPDVNHGSRESVARTQLLNAAYEVLGGAERRRAYDRELDAKQQPASRTPKGMANITQDVHLKIEEFIRGTALEISVKDPAAPQAREIYEFTIPPGTAPGARFRILRDGTFGGGIVIVRVRVLPNFRFKVSGPDLRCDLKIKPGRVTQGGMEMIPGVTGGMLRVEIPRGIARGEIIRIPGEGLPRARGGRGDLRVRIIYRPEVRIRRAPRR